MVSGGAWRHLLLCLHRGRVGTGGTCDNPLTISVVILHFSSLGCSLSSDFGTFTVSKCCLQCCVHPPGRLPVREGLGRRVP